MNQRGKCLELARAHLGGAPVSNGDPQKPTGLTSLQNERKQVLTRVAPSGDTSCPRIKKVEEHA